METRFSTSVKTDPGVHPASYTMGTGPYPEVKRPGRGVEHPPPFSAEVNRREKSRTILLLPLWAFVASSRAIFSFTFTFTFTLHGGLVTRGPDFRHINYLLSPVSRTS